MFVVVVMEFLPELVKKFIFLKINRDYFFDPFIQKIENVQKRRGFGRGTIPLAASTVYT